MKAKWTAPYEGITHIKNTPEKHQITLFCGDKHSYAYRLNKDSKTPFTTIEEVHGTQLACKLEAEKWLQKLCGICNIKNQ